MAEDVRLKKLAGPVAAVVVLVGGAAWTWYSDFFSDFFNPRPMVILPEEVKDGAYEYVVGVNFQERPEPRCTGTVIAPRIVLTAAHCLRGMEGSIKQVMIGRRAAADAGSWYQDVVDHRRRMHPNGDNVSGSDLALLELRNPAQTASGKRVAPLEIAVDTVVDGAASYRIVGFGATNTAGTVFPKRKLQSKLPVPTRTNNCRAANDATEFGCFPGQEIVAGRTNSPDTCKGDSGGPLLVDPKGTGGVLNGTNFALAGVTSRGIAASSTTCGAGGIYERLDASARDWIREMSAELLRSG